MRNVAFGLVTSLVMFFAPPSASADCQPTVRVVPQRGLVAFCDGHALLCFVRWTANVTPAPGPELGLVCANGNTYSDDEMHPSDDSLVPEGQSIDRRAIIAQTDGQVLHATGDLGTGTLRFHTIDILGLGFSQVYLGTGMAEEVPSHALFAWDNTANTFGQIFSDTSYVFELRADLAGASSRAPTIDTCERTWTWDRGPRRFTSRSHRMSQDPGCNAASHDIGDD